MADGNPLEGIRSIRELPIENKRVFVRVDFNVPLEDGKITDDSRIREALPTIKHALERGARLDLRQPPRPPEAGAGPEGSRSSPCGARLAELPRRTRCTSPRTASGTRPKKVVYDLRAGQVCLLENLRFHPEEEKDDEGFASELAELADVYVDDAFGAVHRAHASVHGLAKLYRDRGLRLPPREGDRGARQARRPARRSRTSRSSAARRSRDKIAVVESLLEQVDALVIGGAMANTFLAAQGKNMQASLVEADKLAARAHHPREGAGEGRRGAASRSTSSWRRALDGDRRARPSASTRSPRGRWRSTSGPKSGRSLRASASRTRRPSSGTGRWASSRRPRSPRARSAWRSAMARLERLHRRRRRRQRRGRSRRGRGRRREDEAHLHRRRRLARAHRREEAPRHRGSARRRERLVNPSRRPLIAGNWKMYHGGRLAASSSRPQCVRARARALRASTSSSRRRSPRSPRARTSATASRVEHRRAEHATRRTRARSPARSARRCSKDAGCTWVILGHSERRQHFGETDAFVAEKVARGARGRAHAHRLRRRDARPARGGRDARGRASARCAPFLAVLAESDDAPSAIAYEPVWAIGTGKNAGPAEARRSTRPSAAGSARASARARAGDAHPLRRVGEARQRRARSSPAPTSTAPSSAEPAWTQASFGAIARAARSARSALRFRRTARCSPRLLDIVHVFVCVVPHARRPAPAGEGRRHGRGVRRRRGAAGLRRARRGQHPHARDGRLRRRSSC